MKVKTPESVMTTSFVFLMPLTFASNIFVGLETMPAWLQSIVRHNPVTHLANASRGLMHGQDVGPDVLGCWSPPPSSWRSPRRSPCACTTRSGEPAGAPITPSRSTAAGRRPIAGTEMKGWQLRRRQDGVLER